MFIVTVTMKHVPVQFRFCYKEKSKAESEYSAQSNDGFVHLSDDWGQKGSFPKDSVAVTMSDLEQGMLLSAEVQRLETRAQARNKAQLEREGIQTRQPAGPWDRPVALPSGSPTGGSRA